MVVCVICGKAEKKGMVHCGHRMKEISEMQYLQAKKNLKEWGKEERHIAKVEKKRRRKGDD